MGEFRVNSRMCEHDFALIKSHEDEMARAIVWKRRKRSNVNTATDLNLNVDVIILLINERFSTLNKRIIDSRMINSSFYWIHTKQFSFRRRSVYILVWKLTVCVCVYVWPLAFTFHKFHYFITHCHSSHSIRFEGVLINQRRPKLLTND